MWPTLVCAAAIAAFLLTVGRVFERHSQARWFCALRLVGAALLTLLAVKAALEAADYSWMHVVGWLTAADAGLGSTRRMQVLVTVGGVLTSLLIVYTLRGRLAGWLRFLGTLGFAFAALAALRLLSYGVPLGTPESEPDEASSISQVSRPADAPLRVHRKVVWLVFDELDQEQVILGGRELLPNLASLTAKGVAAEQAYAPAGRTLESIPALLMGVPVTGSRSDGPLALNIRASDGTFFRFDSKGSVFDRLPSGPKGATVLGYYHPYCSLFKHVSHCEHVYLGNAGRWFDGLTFFSQSLFSAGRWINGFVSAVPESFWRAFDPMFRVTEKLIDAVPRVLAREAELSFIHLSLPHVPATYSQKKLGARQTADDDEMYKQNMAVADWVLGRVLALITTNPSFSDALVVVSSDHWLRLRSPRTPQPVPFIAWRVGETAPRVIPARINTVHTASLIVDFLRGDLSSHDDIVTWWSGKPAPVPWVANRPH